MIKIAVLVSGGGTNLQALIDAQKAGAFPNGEIALVMASNQKAYALERAKNAGIESVVVSRKSFVQKAVEVLPGDTPEVLQRRVMEQAEWKLLPQAVAMLCEQLDAETGN